MRKLITWSAAMLIVVLGAWSALGTAGARQPSARPATTQVRGTTTVRIAHTKAVTSQTQSAVLQAQTSNETAASGETGSENGTENESEAENGSETGGEEAGDVNESDGYEDPDGVDVNHECPPDCGPGEIP